MGDDGGKVVKLAVGGSKFGRSLLHADFHLVLEPPQVLLRLLALGDVLDDTRHSLHSARRVGAMASGGPNPPDLAVGPSDAALETPVALRRGGLTERRIHRRAVFRQHMLEEHFVGPLREQFLVAKDAVVFQRTKGSVIDQIEVPCPGMAGFQGEPQPLLALPQGGLRLLALGYIAQDHGEKLMPLDFNLGDRSFNGELLAIDPQSGDGAQCAHCALAHAGFAIVLNMADMGGTEALRNKAVYALAQHFGRGNTEHFFSRRIEQHDALLGVNRNDRIHRRGNNPIEPGVAFPHGLDPALPLQFEAIQRAGRPPNQAGE